MGKLIATTQATLDGVIDPVSEWVQPDGDHGAYSFERQADSGGLVLGRKTYEGLAGYWPSQTGTWADMVNSLPKFVGSNTLSGELEWNATLLEGDLEESIPKLTSGESLGFDDPTKRQFSDVFKPVVCAVNGFCIAGGLEMLLGTDIRIAAEHATFGLGEVRWGVIPAGGSHIRLPRQVPWAIAMELLLGPTDELAVRRIERLVDSVTSLAVVPELDFAAAAALFRAVRRLGHTPRSSLDCLIAAIAIRHDAELLHQDADFEAIAEVSDLRQHSLRQ